MVGVTFSEIYLNIVPDVFANESLFFLLLFFFFKSGSISINNSCLHDYIWRIVAKCYNLTLHINMLSWDILQKEKNINVDSIKYCKTLISYL